jgi:hypothetical protein
MQLAFVRGTAWAPEIRFPETDSTIFLMWALDLDSGMNARNLAPSSSWSVSCSPGIAKKGNFTPELFQSAIADIMKVASD